MNLNIWSGIIQTRSKYYSKLVAIHLNGNLTRSLIEQHSSQLNSAEKKLLFSRILLKERSFLECIELLTFSCTNDFLKAEQYFISATVYNHLAKHEEATTKNLKAYELYSSIKERRGQFLSSYNLSVDFGKLSLYKLSEYYLSLSKRHAVVEDEFHLVRRGKLVLFEQFKNEPLILNEKLDEFMLEIENLNLLDQVHSSMIVSELYFQIGEHKKSEKILLGLIKNRKGIQIDRIRLDYYCFNIISEKNENLLFKMHSNEYFLKYELLRSIQVRNRNKRRYYWKQLQTKFPHQFLEYPNLSDKGFEHGVFFLSAFEKLRSSNKNINFKSKVNKINKLTLILENSENGIKKEELIEGIWNLQPGEYTGSYDARFHKLLERTRKNGLNITYVDNVYILAKYL